MHHIPGSNLTVYSRDISDIIKSYPSPFNISPLRLSNTPIGIKMHVTITLPRFKYIPHSLYFPPPYAYETKVSNALFNPFVIANPHTFISIFPIPTPASIDVSYKCLPT